MFANIKLATIIKLTRRYISCNKELINKKYKSREFVQIYRLAKYLRIIKNIKVKNTRVQN